MKLISYMAASFLILSQLASAELIFDSFTPPDLGGFSSPDQGVTTQIHVAQETRITSFSILNENFTTTRIKFAIYNHPQHERLYLSDEFVFPADSGFPTWKLSPQIDFVLQAGQDYHIGYGHDVAVNDVWDNIPETMNGISSGFNVSIIDDFDSMNFERHFIIGADSGIRLFVPEPTTWHLSVIAMIFWSYSTRRHIAW